MRINEEKELCMGIKGKLKNKKNTFYFEVTVSEVFFCIIYDLVIIFILFKVIPVN